MRIPNFIVVLLVIVVTAYTLLPLIYAHPQPSSEKRDLQESMRDKRDFVDDLFKFGKSLSDTISEFGEDIFKAIRSKFNFKSRTSVFKDAERLCRGIKGPPSKYNILCLEDMGNSLFLNLLSSLAGFDRDVKPKPKPTINIDVIFAIPPLTTPKPTTEKPFDWPGFVLKVFNLTKDSLAEFGENIKVEMNKIADRAEKSDAANAIISAAKGIKQIGDTFEKVDKHADTIGKNIKGVDEGVRTAAKGVSTSIKEGAGVLKTSLDSNLGKVAADVKAGSGQVAESVEKGAKAIEAALKDNTQSNKIENIIKAGLESVNKAILAVSTSLQQSLDASVKVLDESLKKAADLVQKSVETVGKNIGESIKSSSSSRDKTIVELGDKLAPILKGGISEIVTSLDKNVAQLQTTIKEGSEAIQKAIGKLEESSRSSKTDSPPFDGKELQEVLDRNLQAIQEAINGSSLILQTMADILKKIQKSLPEKDKYIIVPHKVEYAVAQSQILNEINDIVENIIIDPHNIGFDRASLSFHVAQLADSLVVNNETWSAGLELMKIANEISDIDTDEQDALEILGAKLEKFGAIVKDIDFEYELIKTGELFASIGSFMKGLPMYILHINDEGDTSSQDDEWKKDDDDTTDTETSPQD